MSLQQTLPSQTQPSQDVTVPSFDLLTVHPTRQKGKMKLEEKNNNRKKGGY
jgi:hypothetical protein